MHFLITTYLVIIGIFLCLLPNCQGLKRYPRRTGDQAPVGECQEFYLGGLIGVHSYVCCNNCHDDDVSCDGTTYHSASNEVYCDACGTDGAGDGNADAHYWCGGCQGQAIVEETCRTGLRNIYRLPSLCWAFAWCFKNKCKRRGNVRGVAADVTTDTCFDLVCNNGETVESCPLDCCGTVNPECDWATYNATEQCPRECCGEPSCCEVSGTAGIEATSVTVLAAAWLATCAIYSTATY